MNKSMTLRKIAQIGQPVLRAPSTPVARADLQSVEVQTLIDDLIETMRDAHGAGLAAPQVHVPLRICVLEVGENPRYPYKPKVPLTILINPVLTPLAAETFENFEGCLSVPNLRGRVTRAAHLRVQAWDRTGRALDFETKGITAGTYQHEVDHLDGTLFVDRVTDHSSLCTWEHFSRYFEQDFKAQVEAVVARWGS